MPSIANITVKKSDGTTDIVYDALSASGGDGSPAVWRQDTGAPAAMPVGLRKSLTLAAKWNGPKTARLSTFNYVAPYAVQDSTTTLYQARDKVLINGTAIVPQAIPASEINEAIYQACNLLAATLIKQAMAGGYSAT